MNAKTLLQDMVSTGLKQQQIAKLTGLSQGYVCDLLSGRHGSRIGHEAFKRIQDAHTRIFTLAPNARSASAIPHIAAKVGAGNTAAQ